MHNYSHGENKLYIYIYCYCKTILGGFKAWETNRFYNNVFIPLETYFGVVNSML